MHPHLTVFEALSYAARLRLPEDSSRAEIETTVRRVIGELGLSERADTRIGALSGGQRKRVGVATELLNRPSLLCLDEPTTGLDPGLEQRMMKLLRALADDSRAVIVVTHATRSLELCDRIAVMGEGGLLCFFGTPAAALEFFGVQRADDLYEALERLGAKEWRARYVGTNSQPPDGTEELQANVQGSAGRPPKRHAIPQTRVLLARYMKLFLRDRRNVLILLGQVPLLALAIAGLFDPEVFSRNARKANESAQLLFLLVTTAIWIGSIDAAREVIKERAILASEVAVGLRLRGYLGSKALVLFALTTVQVAVLVGIVLLLRRPHESAETVAMVAGLILLTSWVAVAMGLLISAAVNTEAQATSFIPLVLLPQLLFAGAIVPVARMNDVLQAVSSAIFARWSFAGVGSAVDMEGRIAADPAFSKVSRYGPDFFDLSAAASAAIMLGFLMVLFALVALSLKRRTR